MTSSRNCYSDLEQDSRLGSRSSRDLEHVSKPQVPQTSEAKENANQLWCPFTCGSGERPIGVQFAAGRHARLVVLGEDLTDEFSAAAHPHLVEDGLEVIAHGVGRDVQLLGDFGR